MFGIVLIYESVHDLTECHDLILSYKQSLSLYIVDRDGGQAGGEIWVYID
ncbi:MAG: hypothetical protein VSS75_030930 [Candidatus Parabeggiatoa sp.]|nr:hypothetical protein [Candidatus Parabeggiatoa sp.]